MEFSDFMLEECGDAADSGKGKNQWNTLIKMLRMMGTGFWRYLGAIVVMSIAMAIFDTVTAFLLKNIISRAGNTAQGNVFAGLQWDVLKCVCVGVVCMIFYAFGYYVYTMEAKKGGANLQRAMYAKAMRLPYTYYDNTHSGEFMSKIIYDCERAQGIYGSRFRRIIMPFIMTVCYLIPMFWLNRQVTLCLFLCSAALFIVNAVFVKPMRKLSGKMSLTHVSLTERISDILSGMEQIKIFGLQEEMTCGYADSNREYKRQQRKMNLMSACLDGLNQCFDLMGSLVFIAVGVFFVGKRITTIDSLAAIYVLYVTMAWNFLQVGIYIPSMASYLANAKRVFEFLDLEEEQGCRKLEGIQKSQKVKGNVKTAGNESMDGGFGQDKKENLSSAAVNDDLVVRMENVTFSYDSNNDVLHNFNLNIKSGKSVALKGESGKGKSTIAKLLLGFYSVNSGEIYLMGKSYDEYELWQIRELIGYVPQEPYLYDVSIEENIRYGKPGASFEEIVHAAKLANAHDFIINLEKGYSTNAGERGNSLSGGERQRIAIARAILKNAPVLILDEATSALDNESEKLVNEALKTLMKGKTTIVIAHRQSTLEQADEIIEI